MVQPCAAVGAVCQPGEHTHFSHLRGTAALLSGLLHNFPGFRVNDGLVGVFNDYPFLRGIGDFLFGLIGQFCGLEISCAAQIGVLL